jgi:hypothetical protein
MGTLNRTHFCTHRWTMIPLNLFRVLHAGRNRSPLFVTTGLYSNPSFPDQSLEALNLKMDVLARRALSLDREAQSSLTSPALSWDASVRQSRASSRMYGARLRSVWKGIRFCLSSLACVASSPTDSTEAQVDLLRYRVIAILQIVENTANLLLIPCPSALATLEGGP